MPFIRNKISDNYYEVWCGDTLFATFNFLGYEGWEITFEGIDYEVSEDGDCFPAEKLTVWLTDWQIRSIIAMFDVK